MEKDMKISKGDGGKIEQPGIPSYASDVAILPSFQSCRKMRFISQMAPKPAVIHGQTESQSRSQSGDSHGENQYRETHQPGHGFSKSSATPSHNSQISPSLEEKPKNQDRLTKDENRPRAEHSSSIQGDLERLHLENNKLVSEKNRLSQIIERLLFQNKKLVTQNNDLREETEIFKEALQKAQECAYNVLDQPLWTPSVESTKRRLRQFEINTRQWSREYATERKMEDLINEKDKDLQNCLYQVTRYNAVDLADSLGARMTTKKVMAMILQACLTSFIYRTTLTNPFFFFDARLRNKTQGTIALDSYGNNTVSQGLYQALQEIVECGDSEAHAWRSQTLRLLEPRASAVPPDKKRRINLTKDATERAIHEACLQHAEKFLKTSYSLLIKDTHADNMKKELEKLLLEAGDLSYHLWTQKVDVEYFSLKELPANFDQKHEYLEEHPSQKAQVMENEASLDGKPIWLVVHPAVLAYGDSDGSNYDAFNVWKKATVWIGPVIESPDQANKMVLDEAD